MRPLVFSMGFNGYQDIWARCIKTHEIYADHIGADYVFVGKAEPTPLLMESAWLKIPLLLSAFRSGRDAVLYIDSDTVISPAAPAFTDVMTGHGDLYMAKGFSGRVNSGVIIAKKSERLQCLLAKIILNAGINLPQEDVVGWGENGEVIHFTRQYDGLTILPREWNNNTDPNLPDFIRHYSAGPLRATFEMTEAELEAQQRSVPWNATHGRRQDAGSADFYRELLTLFTEVIARKNEFLLLDLADIVAAARN